ncbi:hypothetical protein [Shewanella algidipiscicola]|uniref:Uncharacterized protein n=1 Tax=Shewanella algidipiscicola TaxID=614070 RepID=A0ABQ4PLU3_9GAMM|nr:hypothetical protein [Shewanella algidipiscicola]GIU49089.1 hypothetical protein TUM4630_26930 [Shewanella algidipiscicola]
MNKKYIAALLTLLVSSSVFANTSTQCKTVFKVTYDDALTLQTDSILQIDPDFDVNQALTLELTSTNCAIRTKNINQVPDVAQEGGSRTITQKRENVLTTYVQVYKDARWVTTSFTQVLIDPNKDEKKPV